MSTNKRPALVMPISSVIAIALITFVFGLYVGRGMAPRQVSHAQETAGMADPHQDIDTAKVMEAISASDNFEMLVSIGNDMFDRGLPKLAIPAYEKALKIKPNDADIRTDLGIMYKDADRVDDGLREFREAMRIDPNHENSHYNLGIVLLHNKSDLKGAVRVWEEYLRKFPNGQHADRVREHLARLKDHP